MERIFMQLMNHCGLGVLETGREYRHTSYSPTFWKPSLISSISSALTCCDILTPDKRQETFVSLNYIKVSFHNCD